MGRIYSLLFTGAIDSVACLVYPRRFNFLCQISCIRKGQRNKISRRLFAFVFFPSFLLKGVEIGLFWFLALSRCFMAAKIRRLSFKGGFSPLDEPLTSVAIWHLYGAHALDYRSHGVVSVTKVAEARNDVAVLFVRLWFAEIGEKEGFHTSSHQVPDQRRL